GLEEELAPNVLLARSKRAAHADFLGPLDDRDEHDVGDDDRADDERNPGNQNHQQEGALRNAAPERLKHVRGDQAERVVAVVGGLAWGARYRAPFVGGGRDRLDATSRLDEDADVVVGRDVLVVDGQRNVDDVVLALAHDRAELLDRADDANGIAVDLHRPADRIDVREELVLNVPSDDGHRSRLVVLGLREVPPVVDGETHGRAHVRRVALDLDVRQRARVGLQRPAAFSARGDRLAAATLASDDLHVGQRQVLALLRHEPLFAARDDPVLVEDDDVGIQADDLVLDVGVQSGDHG